MSDEEVEAATRAVGTTLNCSAATTVGQLHYEVALAALEAAAAVRVPVPGESEAREQPRVFVLDRVEDVSGTSGIGVVAWGCCFPDGAAVLRWNTDPTSTAVYASMDAVEAIHGHEGRTRVAWLASRPSVREAQEGKAEAARNRLHAAADAIRAVQREAQEGTP